MTSRATEAVSQCRSPDESPRAVDFGPMRTAAAQQNSAGWLRIEVAEVQTSEVEARELRTHDVLLVDSLGFRSDRGESGPALLVLSNGLRFKVVLSLEQGSWVAQIGEAQQSVSAGDSLSVNLVHRVLDSRELPDFLPGARVALDADPSDQLIISWREEILCSGTLIEIEGEVGVRVRR